MPDGDIVHSRLARLYQKPYQWLCEGKADRDECARIVMAALKRDLMRKGDLPVILANRMGEILERAINDATESSSVDWVGLNMKFDTLVWQADGRPDLKELTLGAAKSVLHDLRYGREIDADNISETLLKRYMFNGVYESEFKERISLISEHHNGTCILRKQALAASKIEDRTRYVVPHGDRPAGDPSLHLRHMLAQVCTFRRLLDASDNHNFQWEALTRKFLRLDDIVDRTAAAENLLPADMQSRLIKLYQTYVAEWDTVESRIAAEFLDKDSEQQVSEKLSLH